MAENMSFLVEAKLTPDCLLEVFSYLSLDDMNQVKNVCRTWYQVSQDWFKQQRSLVFTVNHKDLCKWKIQKKFFKSETCTGSDYEDVISNLHLYGHHIKYYEIRKGTKINHRANERNNLMFKLVPELSKNIVDFKISNYYPHPPFLTFEVMATHWRKLEKLFIEHLTREVGEDVHELLHNNEQLKNLTLKFKGDWLSPMNDKFFNYLPTTIVEINIVFNSGYHKCYEELKYFIPASKNFTSLRSLKLFKLNYLSNAAMLAIAEIKSLTQLNLIFVSHYESRNTIDPISSMKGLKSLHLTNNYDLVEDSLINIVKSCIHLEDLSIRTRNVLTDEGMAAIAKLNELKILRIDAKHVSTESIISSCDRLEVFSCFQSKITESGVIELLKTAKDLKIINFHGCENLTKGFYREAKKIADDRKKNILWLSGHYGSYDSNEMDTPYFKYFHEIWDVPLELFPNHIKNYIKLMKFQYDIMYT